MPDSATKAETTPPSRAVFKVFIKGTVEAVWREITKTDSVQQCMFNMRLHAPRGLAVGMPIRMRSKNGKYTAVVGEITEWDPPRRYAHTFKFTNFDDPPCRVVYELEKAQGEGGSGVNFTLAIEDMPAGTKTAKQMTGGGKMITSTLKAIVETGRPSLGVRLLYVLFKVMEPLSPKKCRSENWP